jgi:hypothetical protein
MLLKPTNLVGGVECFFGCIENPIVISTNLTLGLQQARRTALLQATVRRETFGLVTF